MSHYVSYRFCHAWQALPRPVQARVERIFRLPVTHPLSGAVVRICDRRLRALPAAPGYLALGVPMTGGIQWFWIGTRESYRDLLTGPGAPALPPAPPH